jgi:hypothetical protein
MISWADTKTRQRRVFAHGTHLVQQEAHDTSGNDGVAPVHVPLHPSFFEKVERARIGAGVQIGSIQLGLRIKGRGQRRVDEASGARLSKDVHTG